MMVTMMAITPSEKASTRPDDGRELLTWLSVVMRLPSRTMDFASG